MKYNLMIDGKIGINGTPISQNEIVNKLNSHEEQIYDLKQAILLVRSKYNDEHCNYHILHKALIKVYGN